MANVNPFPAIIFGPENIVCCIYSNPLQTNFNMDANTMKVDQTAAKGAV